MSKKSPNKVVKYDITRKITTDVDLHQPDVHKIVQRLFHHIADMLVNENTVELRKFGVFKLRVAKERKARNPKKPQNEVIIPEHVAVRFKSSEDLKKRVLQIKPKDIKSN